MEKVGEKGLHGATAGAHHGGRGEAHEREAPRAHAVRFYGRGGFPVESVASFLAEGVRAGDSAGMILTPRHTRAVRKALALRGVDTAALEKRGRLLTFDAEATLGEFLVRNHPDPARFRSVVGEALARAIPSRGLVRVAGEMVALLVQGGNPQAALELESLWSALVRRKPIRLVCCYPLDSFAATALARTFGRVTAAHGEVSPARDTSAERVPSGRWVARLQQQARALEAEIAERRRAEEALEASHEQLRALGRHMQGVREEERARISRRVHDELEQSLTALKMDLEWLARKLDRAPGAHARVRRMSGAVDQIMLAVSNVANELRPDMLDDLGLAETLEWQAREFSSRSGVACELDLGAAPATLDRARRTTLFRIFQEALVNVFRHARASTVRVRLAAGPSGIELLVSDDGAGITASQLTAPRSFGLIGMRESALAIGADLVIESAPGGGTMVRVHLPPARTRRERA
jgi:signal transduction histidine kinase